MDVLEDILINYRSYKDTNRSTISLCGNDHERITCTDDANKKCEAIFIKKLLKETCSSIIDQIECDHLIIVCQSRTPQCMEYLADVYSRVQVMPLFRLEYNILRSPHVPKYTILTTLQKESVSPDLCLEMLRTDAVAIMLGLQPGDLVREESACPLLGMSMRYRTVIF